MGPGEGAGSWERRGEGAEGLKWHLWAELLCLGSFNHLLGSAGLRPWGEGSHGRKAEGTNWSLGSRDHLT